MNNDESPHDHLVAAIVLECLQVMRDYPTRTKLTACCNLTERVLRLFTIQGDQEWVNSLIDELHEGIKKEINEMYE